MVAPVDGAHALVERVLSFCGKATERQEDATGHLREEAGAIALFERSGKGDPSPSRLHFASAETLEFARQKGLEPLLCSCEKFHSVSRTAIPLMCITSRTGWKIGYGQSRWKLPRSSSADVRFHRYLPPKRPQ